MRFAGMLGVADVVQQLAEREQADQHRQECESLLERFGAEIEAGHSVDLVFADRGHEQAQRPGDQSLEELVARKAGGDRQGEGHEREIVPGTELEADACQLGRQCHQQHGTDDAAEERGPHPEPQSQPGLAGTGHGESVERGRDRRRRSRDAGENARHQATGQTAHEHGHHRGEPLDRVHAERERQGQDDRHGDREAGNAAGQETSDRAQGHETQGLDSQHGRHRILKCVDHHGVIGRQGPSSRGELCGEGASRVVEGIVREVKQATTGC